MRHATVVSRGIWCRALFGAGLLLALLAPLNCATDIFDPNPPPPPAPPPPPPPPPAPPCTPVIQGMRLERFGGSAAPEGKEIAVLGADIGVSAILQLSCSGGSLPSPNWSVDNSAVIQMTNTWRSVEGQITGIFTALVPGQAVVAVEWGGLHSSMAIEVPPAPAIGRLLQISAGRGATCASSEANRIFCWGDNRYFMVSNQDLGSTGGCPIIDGPPCRPVPLDRNVPVVLEGVDVGFDHACGLANGVAWCWGSTGNGVGGPQDVPGTAGLRSVSAGGSHSCGLNDQGTAFCWGNNFSGQLGNTTTTSSSYATPVSGDQRYASISAGESSTCGLTAEGALFCWGDGKYGADSTELCGLGGKFSPTPCRKRPTRVDLALAGNDSVFRALSLGSHACAVSSSGRLYCWNGVPFTLGVKSDSARVILPSPVETGLLFESVTVGERKTCGLVAGGAAYCWGPSPSIPAPRNFPEAVPGGLHFRSISAGDQHVCGIALDGKAYCWGSNERGQLGAGHRNPSATPILILGQQQ